MNEALNAAPQAKLSFSKLASPFKVERIATELLQPSSKHVGRQDVLFAGFAGYTVLPQPDIARQAMQLKCLSIYLGYCMRPTMGASQSKSQTESEDAQLPRKKEWTLDQVRYFETRIYRTLGGPKIVKSICNKEIVRELDRASEQLMQAHRMVQIWHWILAQELPARGIKLNIAQCAEAAAAIGYLDTKGDRVKRKARTYERAWEATRKTVALSYAARSILVKRKGTILDLMLAQSLSFGTAKPLLEQWFRRAKFVHNTIFGALHPGKKERRFVNLSVLPVEPEEFAAPHFERRDAEEIKTLCP